MISALTRWNDTSVNKTKSYIIFQHLESLIGTRFAAPKSEKNEISKNKYLIHICGSATFDANKKTGRVDQ